MVKRQNIFQLTFPVKYLQVLADKMNIMLVGNKAFIKQGLEKLGYDVMELDTNGNAIISAAAPAPAENLKDKKKKAKNNEKTGPGVIRTF